METSAKNGLNVEKLFKLNNKNIYKWNKKKIRMKTRK